MSIAPIVLFVYNRLDHTRQTIEALQHNSLSKESELYIYADAAKHDAALPSVNAVRNYLLSVAGFRNVHIHLRENNLGVDENVILGVTEVIDRHGKAIVMEDDLVTSPFFLQYMNDALDHYENEERVISVHGYTYPLKEQLKEVFLLKGADCWGWATWKRGWDLFEPDGMKLLKEMEQRHLEAEFEFNHTYAYMQALRDQAEGRTTCWDIRWYAAAFLKDKLTLYPGISLVSNIGLDGSGTHCGPDDTLAVALAQSPLQVKTEVVPDRQAYLAFANFLGNLQNPAQRGPKGWLSRSFKSIRELIRNSWKK